MLNILVFFMLAALPSIAGADSLGERFSALAPQPAQLFHAPSSPLEQSLLDAGRSYHWLRYERSEAPSPSRFRGYALYSDPYHRGLGRISFLVGADCSHFVHRIFQMLGADYPYAKTRHFIALARDANQGPADLPACRWRRFRESFAPIETSAASPGDVLVFPNAQGLYGEHGHMGILSAVEPLEMLHAMSSREGLVRGPVDAQLRPSMLAFRWKGPLREEPPRSLPQLLARSYPEDPAPCDELR